MNDANPSIRRFSIAIIVAVTLAILLAAVACVYIWLRSTASWGSIGTLEGHDVRPDRHAMEMNLKNELQDWLEDQGFKETTLPESLVESRGDDWNSSINSPVVYGGTIDGDTLFVAIEMGNHDGKEYWRANMYYRTVPQDIQWLPGAEAGHDSASRTFEAARAFLRKTRARYLAADE